jgi:transposase
MDAAQIKRAGALRRKGLSVREVASRMGLPKSTVDRALRAA